MNFVKALGFGTLGLLALGFSWKIFRPSSANSSSPSRQQTLQILQTIRQEFYPVLLKIANLVQKELAPKGMTPEQNESYILLDAAIKSQITRINEKVYVKYSEDEIRQAAEQIYKDDGDILKQKREFTEEYRKSLLGVKPEPNMIVSRKLHKGRVLETIEQILEDKIARFQTQNPENLTKKEIEAFLESDIQQDQIVTKEKIKQKLGLCAKDSIRIFHFVVLEYKKTDESFRNRYLEIVDNYNEKIKKILKQ